MTTTTFVDEVTVIEASWLNDVNADVYGVRPVATGGTGATNVADARTNLGLGNVDNTSDANKPVSTAQQAALNLKIDNASKDATGGVPGLTLFKLNMRNAANTITSWFTNAATVARTWTLPDKDGTVAMLSDFASPGAIGGTTPAAGTFTTLTVTGNAALGDAEATDTHAINGATTLLANSASAALTVTQTGAGNAFVVEDSASTDSTPFVIDASGNVAIGLASPAGNKLLVADETSIGYVGRSVGAGGSPITLQRNNTSLAAPSIVASGNILGQLQFSGYDGANYIQAAGIFSQVDGTPGTNDMPGRLVFSTTADGASGPTERMRIDSAGNVGIGGAAQAFSRLELAGTFPSSSAITIAAHASGVIPSGTTNVARMFSTTPSTQAAAFTCSNLQHYYAEQGTIGAGSAVTNQYGFLATNTLTGATNNYGFYSNIPAAANRYNFYAAGTADNYFAGSVGIGSNALSASGVNFRVDKNITGNTSSINAYIAGEVQSGVTGDAHNIYSAPSVVNAVFTLPALYHFRAVQGTFGASATVTNQFGFNVSSNLTGATNNYGFYSNIPAAANRYNFYAAGTAANYFAGDTGIGSVANTGIPLTLNTASGNCELRLCVGGASTTRGQVIASATDMFIANNGTGNLNIFAGGSERLRVTSAGQVVQASATAIPAGGTAGFGYCATSTANFGVFFGSGAPTLSAAQGSIYLRSDGSSTSTRMYVNTNGTTGWTAVTTAT